MRKGKRKKTLQAFLVNEAPRVKARGLSQTLRVERNPDHASIYPDENIGVVLSRRDKYFQLMRNAYTFKQN